MFSKAKIYFGLGTVLVLFFLGIFYWRSLGSKDIAVAKVAVEVTKNYPLEVQTTGRIEAREEVFVSTKRGGRLDRLDVKEGNFVVDGQLIGVIDERIHRSALEGALSSFVLARQELNRISSLARGGSATQQELDQARNNFSNRKSELEQTRQKLEDGLIRSSGNGRINFLPFKIGENIPEGARVAVIEDVSNYQIQITVQPKWIGQIPGEVVVTVWPFNRPRLNNEVRLDAKTLVQDVRLQTAASEFEVNLYFRDLPSGMQSKQIVNIALATKTFENTYAIPQAAVYRLGDRNVIAVVNEQNELAGIPVNIIDQRDQMLIIEGLPPVDKTIVVARDEKQAMRALKAPKKINAYFF